MNILFLTISRIDDINNRGIYLDLMRKFKEMGHSIYIATPLERKFRKPTTLVKDENIQILRIKTLNLQKTNFVEKGIGTVLMEYQYLKAIRKYWNDVHFDLILYTTPPITFSKVIRRYKNLYQAKTYLLLKDIFPQNAVDLNIMKEKSFLCRYFRKKEQDLYALSDHIGCMSPANVEFVIKHNPEVDPHKVEVCPNSITLDSKESSTPDRIAIRKKFNIPEQATFFIYGGNLGKPQGVDFLKDILDINKDKTDRYFIIVGSGTEYSKIQGWFDSNRYPNAQLLSALPKVEYDALVQSADVGLILLDKRFTIPNYPSRLLSYLENRIPVLAATDTNTDIGKIAQENNYGLWCENGDIESFNRHLDYYCLYSEKRQQMGHNGYSFLEKNYTSENAYSIIMNHFS
ncbi:glycosyltransferase family 4 protein [Bacteroidales bacterium OttesenSCG-928-L03]|nr:glycosyltransferase family 4 protein [Bacteroidales bacterium OttesenSCG-928-L03]